MSLTIALAYCLVHTRVPTERRILKLLALPDFVKEDLMQRFIPYLRAVPDLLSINELIILVPKMKVRCEDG